MRSPFLVVFAALLVSSSSIAASPPVSAKIVSNWNAPSLLIQYLETISLESSTALFPFIRYLIETDASSDNSHQQQLLASILLPNETYAILEERLEGSKLLRTMAERESLRMALSNREASVRIETLFKIHDEVLLESAGAVEVTCENWIDWYGECLCTVDAFWTAVGSKEVDGEDEISVPSGSARPSLFDFDHLSPFPTSSSAKPVAILYASPSDSTFAPLYTLLEGLAFRSRPRLQFALRWKAETSVDSDKQKEKLVLSGYGAGLEIKKVEYIAIDDRLHGADEASGRLDEDRPSMQPIPKGDIPHLGLRTAQHILASSDHLSTFVHITASFPVIASQLGKAVPELSDEMVGEIYGNQMTYQAASSNSFHLNGIALTDEQVDPYALLRLMRKERKVIEGVMRLNDTIKAAEARTLLAFEPQDDPSVPQGSVELAAALGEIFDAGDREEGGDVILWWNNLEKDKRYAGWSKSLREMLQPTYPGQMNLVARNVHNVVLVLDLSRLDSLRLVSDNIREYITRGIPIRFGIVPQVGKDGEISTMVAQTLWYLTDKVGRSASMTLLTDLATSSSRSQYISESTLRKVYLRYLSSLTQLDGDSLIPFEAVQQSTTKLDQTRAYTSRLGVRLSRDPSSARGAFFMNGAYNNIDDNLPSNMQRALGITTQLLQQAVYFNKVGVKTANTYFYDLPSSFKRRNRFVFPSPPALPLKVVNLLEVFSNIDSDLAQSPFIEGVSQTDGARYHAAIVTIYVIADLDSVEGRSLVRAALEFVDSNLDSRIFLLHNPLALSLSSHPYQLSDLLYLIGNAESTTEVLPSELLAWIDLDIQLDGPPESLDEILTAETPITPWLRSGSIGKDATDALEYWTKARALAEKFGMNAGDSGLVINGRVIGPFAPSAFASSADFEALKSYELEKRILRAHQALLASTFDFASLERSDQSQIISLLTSIISEASLPDLLAGMGPPAPTSRQQPYRLLDSEYSAVIDSKQDTAIFEIGVVIDPATELAQRWSPIIRTLSKLDSVHLRIHLIPKRTLTEVPIKRFYQYSFDSALQFDNLSGAELPAQITFKDIPETLLLTFATDLPRAWLAFPKQSIYDLDNIRLADISSSSRQNGVKAILELESIIVEGHAREMPSSAPPRGLQLELASGSMGDANVTVDTIVMANLGYWQLKANPGLWRFTIRPGRSSEIFDFESIGSDGMDSKQISETGNLIAVRTLEGSTIYPRFKRKEGQEQAELLSDAVASRADRGKVFHKIKSLFSSGSSSDVAVKKRAEINVLTVASGLLYERMAFIMMVSVMRHTNSTVKFWFIQNFLSPSFRAFIPHMALEYGFEYELVTYKWPHWLRAQKEKQRIIWGYKILFLDVLFPIELDRVIFVDSDQIVRTDLKELIDMDIKGCPYAYAPMGDDRKEVEGFRFWKTGYWEQHLKGATYHISALYLVDLDRFRQIAAGDRLRQHYQSLSADPGSLANLDQDLPNFMYQTLPIFTLDKSWLYCETWHSPGALAAAKTIDLCNDPLTHEPKLVRAKRIPEWTVYDDEIAALARRVASGVEEVDSAIGAFAKRADELEQARQQGLERDEFVAEQAGDATAAVESDEKAGPVDVIVDAVEGRDHVKDEL